MLRAFIAFDFNDDTIDYLYRIQKDYKSLKPARIKYTKPEQFHLTTAFLGDITAKQSEEIINIMKNIKINQEISFKFSRVDYFPSERKPRTIILKAHTDDYVKELIENIDKGLLELEITRDKKWLPHLTFGRSKELFEIPKFVIESFTARAISLTLYKSTLEKEGAIYEKIYSIYL